MGLTSQQQVLIHELMIVGVIFFGPVLLAGLIAASRKKPRYAMRILAIAAFFVLLIGVILFDAEVFRGAQLFPGALDTVNLPPAPVAVDFWFSLVSPLFLAVGAILSLGSLVLSLKTAAERRQWGWCAALAVGTAVWPAAGMAAYDMKAALLVVAPNMLDSIVLDGQRAAIVGFILVWSALVGVPPIVAFLYGLRVPGAADQPAARSSRTKQDAATAH